MYLFPNLAGGPCRIPKSLRAPPRWLHPGHPGQLRRSYLAGGPALNGGLPDAPSAGSAGSPSSRKFPFAQGKAPEGPGAGAGVHGVAADPRGSPHKPRKERRGERGLPGVERYAAGGSPGGGRTWESDPPPEDPLRPPLRGLEGPGRGGVVGEDCPPIPPAFSGLSGRVFGEANRGFCRPGGRKWPICAARAAPPKTPVAASVRASVG